MIHKKILERLQDLKYLGKLKGANVSILSKKSEYHDMVKFFAIIDENNIIQKITFKATGCTNFMVMCSYFCELVEGKKVATALKISKEDLDQIVVLPAASEHVYPIIINTFILLIKKYNKNLETEKATNKKETAKKTNTTKNIQSEHLSNLKDKITTKEKHAKSQNQINHINSMLEHLNKEETKVEKKSLFSRFKKK